MQGPTEIGEWKFISTLGSGSFGTVSLWRHQISLECVAVKKCKFVRPNSLSPKQRDRWNKEVDFLKNVNHPNIIGFKALDPVLAEVLNKDNPTKLPLLPMEYCTKGNLRRFLTSEPIKLCGLPEQDVRDIIRDVSNGLSYLHSKKITHRDIKPDNIVLQHCDHRQSETVYKVIDLGYAKELNDATLSFVGTLHYLAPEIFFSEDYDYRVDYWSVGIMVFELICGSLPFLPEAPPFERFEKIKNKGADDICIYVTRSGSVSNSTEIKRENFISSCLKQNIEKWLRRALQMDPNNRTFSSDLSAFEYLRYILDKKIVHVFSIHKLEFYSYEVNDSTLIGTLKEWISRDIKVPKTDLLVLFRQKTNEKQCNSGTERVLCCNDDNEILQQYLHSNDNIFYVFKKDVMLHEKCFNPKLPGLLKLVFSAPNFPGNCLKQAFRLALFHVYTALHTKNNFEIAYLSLVQYIGNSADQLKDHYDKTSSEFERLLSEVQGFGEKRKMLLNSSGKLDLTSFPKYVESLKHCLRIMSSIERREVHFKDFDKQYRNLEQLKLGIGEAKQDICSIFNEYNIQSQFANINGKGFLLELKNAADVIKPVKDVVSETLKLEHVLYVKEVRLKMYSKELYLILQFTEQLLCWLDNFMDNVRELSKEFAAVRVIHDKIVSEAIRNVRLDDLHFDTREAEKIIKENELVRCEFIECIDAHIAEHKAFVDTSREYLNSLP